MSYQSFHLSKQVIFEPNKVVTGNILAIERDGSMITLDALDPREDHLKLEPVEQTEEVQISEEGRTTRIRSLLNER